MTAPTPSNGPKASTNRKGRRAGFPPEYRTLSPIEKLRWLTANAPALVAAGRLQHSQVEGQKRDLRKQSAHIARIAPTPAWRDEFESGHPFPPRADDPACSMRKANRVLCDAEKDVLWPAAYLQAGATFDVVCLRTEASARKMGLGKAKDTQPAEKQASTSSSSAAALAAAADAQARVIELKLEPEDEESLCQEVLRYTHAGTLVSRAMVMTIGRKCA